jgi:hypothetical protein
MRYAYCALHGLPNGEYRGVGEFLDAIEHHATVHSQDPKPNGTYISAFLPENMAPGS